MPLPHEPTDDELKLAERLFLLLDIAYSAATSVNDPGAWERYEASIAAEVDELEDAQKIITLMIAQQAVALAKMGQSPSILWADFYARWGDRLRET